MEIKIRTAVLDDLPICGKVMYEAFKNIAEQHNFPPDFPNADAAAELLGMMLGSPGFDAVVAEEGGEILGSIFFSSRSDVGGISVITVAPEAQNRTVEIEVELRDDDVSRSLLPGTSADVEVILQTLTEVLRIPTNALMQGKQVLVISDGILVEREVETGLRNWDLVEITAGLQEGEQIVASLDQDEIEAGSQVEIIENDEKP